MKSTFVQPGKVKKAPLILVRVMRGKSSQDEFKIDGDTDIGRDKTCHIRFDDKEVSRYHARIYFDHAWIIEDLNSTNGTYIKNQKIDRTRLNPPLTVEFGRQGPIISLRYPDSGNTRIDSFQSDTFQKYFSDDDTLPVGMQTMAVRETYREIRRKQIRRNFYIGFTVCVLLIFMGFRIYHESTKVTALHASAKDIFYQLKNQELKINELLSDLNPSQKSNDLIRSLRNDQSTLETRYNNFVDKLGLYNNLSQRERLIYRMARKFGECEANMPPAFLKAVLNEIDNYWTKPTGRRRFWDAINRAKSENYIPVTVKAMLDNHVPAEFFYLALQESDFKKEAIGSLTRFGYAKGIWQFIDQTAEKYKLTIGPLNDQPLFDPRDDRFDFTKATTAAAKYINYIYNTDAQASGLLVIASYNFGEHRVLKFLDLLSRNFRMNPKERNYWELLRRYEDKIPHETKDYVMKIFSAAVIGSNPRLFGFDVDAPLKDEVQNYTMYN